MATNFKRPSWILSLLVAGSVVLGGCSDDKDKTIPFAVNSQQQSQTSTTNPGSTAQVKLTDISPNTGDISGGTVVALVGEGFTNAKDTEVTFGNTKGTDIVVTDAKNMTVKSPAVQSAGAVDITIKNSNGSVTVPGIFTYSNNPSQPQGFTDMALAGGSEDTRAVRVGDLDGDQDVDVFVANVGQNQILINDGNGNFADETSTRLPARADKSSAATLADVDGDGDLDVIVANGTPTSKKLKLKEFKNYVLINDGSGKFSIKKDALEGEKGKLTTAVEAGDFNKDGKADLLVSNRGYRVKFLWIFKWTSGRGNKLYFGDGKGKFKDETKSFLGLISNVGKNRNHTSDIQLADVDKDGDLDFFVANFSNDGKGEKNLLAINNGKGKFKTRRSFWQWLLRKDKRLPEIEDDTLAANFVDVDSDGDQDIVVCNISVKKGKSPKSYVLLNNGKGYYKKPKANLMNQVINAHDAASGDVDGDGTTDVVMLGDVFAHAYLGDGSGNLSQAGNGNAAALPPAQGVFRSVQLADVDGNGKLDVIVGAGGTNRLFLNN